MTTPTRASEAAGSVVCTATTRSLTVAALPAFSNRTRNPYNALLYEALARRGVEVVELAPDGTGGKGADVVHIHWPEGNLNHRRWLRAVPRSARLLVRLAGQRRSGARLVWTVHNLGSHARQYPRTERLFWRAFLPLVDGWLALTDDAAAAAMKEWPALAKRPWAVSPIGHYRGVYPDTVNREQARERLGLPVTGGRVVAFVGRIKPYKGVPELIRVFREIGDREARLVVAGRVETVALAGELRTLAGQDDRVLLRATEVPDAELQVYLRAADLVVAPFETILNSASVILALSFDRPVLAPALGSLPAVRHAVGPDWLHLYTGPLTAERLEDAMRAPAPPSPQPDLSEFDWDVIAEKTESLYRRVLG